MSRLMSAAVTLVVLSVAAACGETTAPQPAISAQGQVAHLSGSSGGGGGAVTPPSNCVADVSAFNNTPGYGP